MCVFFFQAEDGIRDIGVTGVQTCALPICWLAIRDHKTFFVTITDARDEAAAMFDQCKNINQFVNEQFDNYQGIKQFLAANQDRKSTRLNSSHANISYAVFCLKKKKKTKTTILPT